MFADLVKLHPMASLLLAVLAGLIAAVPAFLIVYGEYRKHRLPDGRAWKEALRAGGVAFVFFILSCGGAVFVLQRILH